MSNEEFWDNLGYRVDFYYYLLEKSEKNVSSEENQKNLGSWQQYEKKIEQFLRVKSFYDKYYFQK
jgi:hypothetical protein